LTELGNRCGHDPEHPVLELAVAIKPNLPPIIYELVGAIKALVYWQRWKFSALGEQKRSERMEAIVRVLIALTVHTDLVSLRVGFLPRDADPWFRGVTAEQIARWTDMKVRRVTRALNDLRWAGYITSIQPRELTNEGEWRGLAAVRNLTLKFFTHLGMKNKVDSARNDACARLRRAHAEGRAERIRARRQRRRATKTITSMANAATAPVEQERRQREWNRVVEVLREQHPEWSSDELRAAADRLAPRR
jgi:hypothetical protein